MKIYDLTHVLSPQVPKSTDHPDPEFKRLRSYAKDGEVVRQVTTALHTGTHMDTPALFWSTGMTIDQIPIERLYGPGVVLDISRDDWGEISASDLEKARPEIREGDIVVIHTGWHHYYNDHERFQLRHPGLTKDADDWLVAKKISILCCDPPALEHPFMTRWPKVRPDVFTMEVDRERFPFRYHHKTLLGAGILLVEHVGGDLDKVLNTRCTIGVFPPKYQGTEAAQVRIVAIVE